MLSAEDLLAGSGVVHEITIPPELLDAGSSQDQNIMLRPLTVSDLQRIGNAAKDDDSLSAALMVQAALVEPKLKFEQVSQLPAGVAKFMVEQINTFSGISTTGDTLKDYVQSPLAKACFILAKEFGWTPEQVSGMTIGQILMYVEMARGDDQVDL